MTELQHFLVGYTINMILWQTFFKKYFATEKDIEAYNKIWEKILNKWL